MKKVLSIILSLLVVLISVSVIGTTASAAEVSGKCGTNATWSFDATTGTLSISGTGDMTDYSYNNDPPWEAYKDAIVTISISDGITSIGSDCFSSCYYVTDLDIPTSVVSIDKYAFSNCRKLKNFLLPENLKSIGIMSFYGCHSITNIKFPDSLKSIGEDAFGCCDGLMNITIPKSVSNIHSSAFSGSTGIESFTVDDANSYFSTLDGVLYNDDMSELIVYPPSKVGNSFVIPESVTKVRDYAFDDVKNLYTLSISKNVKSFPSNRVEIGVVSFGEIKEFIVSDDNSIFSSEEGVLYDKNKSKLLVFCPNSDILSFKVPDSVSIIDEYAFLDCTKLVSIDLNNVTTIKYFAFAINFPSMTTLHIPTTVTQINKNAFYSSGFNVTYDCDNTYMKNYVASQTDDEPTFLPVHNYVNNGGGSSVCSKCNDVKTYDYIITTDETISLSFEANYKFTWEVSDSSVAYISGSSSTSTQFGSSIKMKSTATFTPKMPGEFEARVVNTNGTITTYVDILVQEGEHQFVKDSTITEPTCSTTGKDLYKCKFCEETEERDVDKLEHDLIHHPEKQATCKVDGYKAYDTCSKCDYSTYEVVGALGHDLINHEAKSATCEDIGWYEYDTCSRCDYTTYDEIANLGHDIIHHDAQEKTCSEIGWDEYDTCSRCSYSTYFEIPASHEWETDYTIDQKPACEATGFQSLHCSECVMIKEGSQVVIPATGHTVVNDYGYAPTCTAPGMTIGSHCSVCNKVLVAQKEILPTIKIKNNRGSYSLNYKESLILTAVTTGMPSDAQIYWYVDGVKAGEGETFKLYQATQNVTVDVKIVDSSGVDVSINGKIFSDTEQVNVNTGFFAKLIAFFKGLFGSLRTITQSIY